MPKGVRTIKGMTQHGKKSLMKRVRHKSVVEGSKRPRTTPVREGRYRNSPHIYTYSEGKSSVNRKTGRR